MVALKRAQVTAGSRSSQPAWAHRRGERRRNHRERLATTEQHAPFDDTELLARVETRERLMAKVRELPDRHRAVVLLRFFEDLTPSEIARVCRFRRRWCERTSRGRNWI